MEAAFLHGKQINLEALRHEYEAQGLSRQKLINIMEQQYRSFSKKHSFICLCCNTPVNMNLTKDEGRPFYFKHMDGSECAYSENTKTYQSQVSKHEDVKKKDVGLTVFKEIVEGQLKPFGVQIERGFSYKKKLAFIPDFILTFPNSDEHWAIDYYTAMAQGLQTGSYARHLGKRMETYKKEGFKVFSFIDDSWLAIDHRTNMGTLLSAEKEVIRQDFEDQKWANFLNTELPGEDIQFLKKEFGITNLPFEVKSVCYVNIGNRSCQVVRFIEATHYDKNLTIYPIVQPHIPLERALSLNHKQDNFLLYSEDEDGLRREFKKALLEKRQKAIQLEKQRVEAERQQKLLEEQNRIHISNLEKERLQEFYRNRQTKEATVSDEITEREIQERIRMAQQRPVNLSPNQWEWYQKTGRYPKGYKPPSTNQVVPNQQPEKKPDKKREKFIEKLMSQPIKGENYINGDSKIWRMVILKWIKQHKVGDQVRVHTGKLINDMKLEGITFNQNEHLAQYPVRLFLDFYQKELKKDMGMRIEIRYGE